MGSKISYAGVAGAVAGVVALLGVYAEWWESPDAVFIGTADPSGTLALCDGDRHLRLRSGLRPVSYSMDLLCDGSADDPVGGRPGDRVRLGAHP